MNREELRQKYNEWYLQEVKGKHWLSKDDIDDIADWWINEISSMTDEKWIPAGKKESQKEILEEIAEELVHLKQYVEKEFPESEGYSPNSSVDDLNSAYTEGINAAIEILLKVEESKGLLPSSSLLGDEGK